VTILVTGSTGMLGTSVCRLASQKGHRVVGVSRGKTPRPLFPNETHRKGDLRSEKDILGILRSEKPQIIVHTAAEADVDRCEKEPQLAQEVNARGTAQVARAAKEVGALLCYISTDYVFDGEGRSPYREEDPPRPVNVYARTKAAGEEAVASEVSAHYILRTSWLFGEGHDSFVHHVLQWAAARSELKLVDDKWSIPSYAPDVAGGILALIEKRPPHGIYHLSNAGGGCSWRVYGEEILKQAGVEVAVRPMSLRELKLAAPRPPMTVLNIEKFQRSVTVLRDWRKALAEYITTIVSLPRRHG